MQVVHADIEHCSAFFPGRPFCALLERSSVLLMAAVCMLLYIHMCDCRSHRHSKKTWLCWAHCLVCRHCDSHLRARTWHIFMSLRGPPTTHPWEMTFCR